MAGPPHVWKGVAVAVCTDGWAGPRRESAILRAGYGGKGIIGGRVGGFAAAAAASIHRGSTRPTAVVTTGFSAWRCCPAAFLCLQLLLSGLQKKAVSSFIAHLLTRTLRASFNSRFLPQRISLALKHCAHLTFNFSEAPLRISTAKSNTKQGIQ